MDDEPAPKRMRLNDMDLEKLGKDDLILRLKKQDSYITALENKTDLGDHNAAKLSEMEDRLHQQQSEYARKDRKDRLLVMRLATKEQELQEMANQLTEMTKGQAPGSNQLRSALLDPALNLIFQRMRKELDDKTKALQQAQDDMAAWKFTADSQMGKRLMSRCRTLIQENQELGNQVSAGRTTKLETELALQKKYSEELKGSQDELNDFVIELDEEVVGMQSTICALQQQLKEAKQQLVNLKSSTKLTEAPAATTPSAAPAVAVAPPETVPLQSNPAPPAVTISAPAATVVVKQERTSDGRVKMETNAAVKVEPRTYDSKVKSEQIEKLTRQSEAELPPPASASWATAFSERPGVKSPSTPTEEETFRIPEAPRTPEMGPMSPAIPEDAASDPAPQEEARTTTGIQSSSEQPMEEDSPVTSWASKEAAGDHGEDDNRTFQFSSVAAEQQQQRVNLRTTEDRRSTPETAVVVGTSANEVRDDRTHRHIKKEKMEAPADVDRSEENTADKETPMETEPVPRTAQEGQNQQVDGIAETKTHLEEQQEDPSAAANKSDDHSGAYAERGEDRKKVSENDGTVVAAVSSAAKNQTALCDSKATSLANNSSATVGVPAPGTPNGDERTMRRRDNKEEKTSDKGTELGSNDDNSGAMNHDDTKNGEFSPAHPEHNTAVTSSSTTPSAVTSSSETNHNQNASRSNCNQANNPNNNSKEDVVESLSKSNEDGSATAIIAPTDSAQQNSEMAGRNTTSSPPSSTVLTDINRTTNSPVKQILVKTNNDGGESGDGELPVSAAGGEIEGQTNVADVPPLRENGPETVSN